MYECGVHKWKCHIFYKQEIRCKGLPMWLGKPALSGVTVPAWAKGGSSGVASSGIFQKHWLMEEVIYKLLLQTLQIKRRQKGGRVRRDAEERAEPPTLFLLFFLSAFSTQIQKRKKNIYLSFAVVCHLWCQTLHISTPHTPRLLLFDRRAKQKDRRRTPLGFVGYKSWGLQMTHLNHF